MKKITMGKQISAGFIIVILISVIIGIVGFYGVNTVNSNIEKSELVDHLEIKTLEIRNAEINIQNLVNWSRINSADENTAGR